MQYKTFSTKWGDPTFGTESGEIEWSMDLLGGLKIRSGYDVDDLEQATRAAFDRWEEVANIDFTEVNSGADLTISTGVLAGGTVGQARWGGFPSTRWGEITMDEEPRWAPYGQGGTDWYAVMLHEIGHIMGLDHFNDVNQIMNPFVAADELGNGDIAGAQAIYGAPASAPPGGGGSNDPDPGGSNTPGVGFSPSDDDGGDDGGSSGLGALLGLLLVAVASLFGFGGGGGVAFAALATAPEDEEDETDEADEMVAKACGHDGPCDCAQHDHTALDEMVFVHNVYVTEADLIEAEGEDWASHDHSHGHFHHHHTHGDDCGCGNPDGQAQTAEVLLTDLVPVTEVLEEAYACSAGDKAPEEDEPDDLLVA